MKKKKIRIDVLCTTLDSIVVKTPFLEVPIEMNYSFFRKRVDAGYFVLQEGEK